MTVSFHELDGESRYGEGAMAGDLAEAKVKEFMASIDRPVHDFGPKHVPTDRAQATTWTEKIRHAPDFLGWGKFIEVQGCYSGTVLFKPDKLAALMEWDAEMPVWFAVYIQSTDEVLICPLQTVIWACADSRSQCIVLDEGTRGEKTAYQVPIEILLDVRVADSFAVDRVIREKTKRAKR